MLLLDGFAGSRMEKILDASWSLGQRIVAFAPDLSARESSRSL